MTKDEEYLGKVCQGLGLEPQLQGYSTNGYTNYNLMQDGLKRGLVTLHDGVYYKIWWSHWGFRDSAYVHAAWQLAWGRRRGRQVMSKRQWTSVNCDAGGMARRRGGNPLTYVYRWVNTGSMDECSKN